MEPRCCACLSPDIGPSPDGRWRCAKCGARFELENAMVTLADAERFGRASGSGSPFALDREVAERELRDPDGVIVALNPHGDAEELRRALDASVRARVIQAPPGAALRVHVAIGAGPHPVLVVDPGIGPALIGPELSLRPEPMEDPVAYTLRWLGRIVADANYLAAGRRPPCAPEAPARPDPRGGCPPRYFAVAFTSDPRSVGARGLAGVEGLSVGGVLALLGERLEEAGIEPGIEGIDVSVGLVDRGGAG